MLMTLREKVDALLTVTSLPRDERKQFTFVLEVAGDAPLEDMLYEGVVAHVNGRYEWYFDHQGNRRRKAG